MELQHIELENLKVSKANVRRKGGRNTADLKPSIRAIGLLQPLVVHKNCEGYEIVAGQRRFHALSKLADEGMNDPVPCIVMQDGDDAKAIEASLSENLTRLPMDEIDQYKAFAALVKQGKGVSEISASFGVTDRLVKQRLAIANLIGPILTAYSKEEIGPQTIRSLTMASKARQKEWWDLFKSDDYAPQGHALKEWLFGGKDIAIDVALFDETDYTGAIVPDLFSENRYFDDAAKFWELQNTAIAKAKERYELDGWQEVIIFDIGEYWSEWEHAKTPKTKGGRVYVEIGRNGEVTFHEGYITSKEAKRLEKAKNGEAVEDKPERAELTKPMQNYLELHRHSAVRTELLGHGGVALRLAVAQIIAGSSLWSVEADPQKANSEAIAESLTTNKAEAAFNDERIRIRTLLGIGQETDGTLVPRKQDWSKSHDVHVVFAKLLILDDASVNMILTFIIAETLPAGSALVEALGGLLNVDLADYWTPDETFFDLFRDKQAINACVKQTAGKAVADAYVSSTAKVQKKIIRDCLDGTRKGRKDWQPDYMTFPMKAYTKRNGIAAIDQFSKVKKRYAA